MYSADTLLIYKYSEVIMKKKDESFNKLRKCITGSAFNLPLDTEFTFNELNSKSGVICSTEVQQDVGRWFAYLVKHANVPFIIVDNNYPITYKKVKGSN